MKVLSLFDGISVAQQAIKELGGGNVLAYYASEIDKHAIEITKINHPSTVRVGDVKTLKIYPDDELRGVDLLIGGSPCQDLSIANIKRQGLAGSRSGLFWEYVRILQEARPRYFVLENVASMPKEARATISEALGVEPIMIDATRVSAQIRKRLFWIGKLTGDNYEQVAIEQPTDRGIILKDILEHDGTSNYIGQKLKLIIPEATKKGYAIASDGQSVDLSFLNSKTRRGRVGDKVKNLMTSQNIRVFINGSLRKLTPIECERLQSLPDNYTDGVSETQRKKALGNAFNCEVIKHILKSIIWLFTADTTARRYRKKR